MHFNQHKINPPGNIQPHLQYQQYQRIREMSLDDLLLDNRIVFMVGEISYRLAAGVIMKLLHLEVRVRPPHPGRAGAGRRPARGWP